MTARSRCFADEGEGKCAALNIKLCESPRKKTSCSFYKPEEKHRSSRREAIRRIQDLKPYIRKVILRKYGQESQP